MKRRPVLSWATRDGGRDERNEDAADAVVLYDQVVRIRESVASQDARWTAAHSLASALLNRSVALRRRRRFTEAEASSTRALEIWERLVEVEGHVDLGGFQYNALMELGCAGAEIEP